MIGIYKITNPKGKIYIGQSVDIKTRMYGHNNPNSECKKLKNSINKYGWDKHTVEVLEECKVEDLNERERFYQDKYNSIAEGLNIRAQSTSDRSGYFNEEFRAKCRARGNGKLGFKHKEVTKEKMRKAGLNQSEEKKKAISESMKRVWAERKAKSYEKFKK